MYFLVNATIVQPASVFELDMPALQVFIVSRGDASP